MARREYDRLQFLPRTEQEQWTGITVQPGQEWEIPGSDWVVSLEGPTILEKTTDSLSTFFVKCDMMNGNLTIGIRPRRIGDTMQLAGGTKSLKRLMIDRKIPAAQRDQIPVITAEEQILAVYGLGTDVRWAARSGDRAVIIKLWHRGEKKP